MLFPSLLFHALIFGRSFPITDPSISHDKFFMLLLLLEMIDLLDIGDRLSVWKQEKIRQRERTARWAHCSTPLGTAPHRWWPVPAETWPAQHISWCLYPKSLPFVGYHVSVLSPGFLHRSSEVPGAGEPLSGCLCSLSAWCPCKACDWLHWHPGKVEIALVPQGTSKILVRFENMEWAPRWYCTNCFVAFWNSVAKSAINRNCMKMAGSHHVVYRCGHREMEPNGAAGCTMWSQFTYA